MLTALRGREWMTPFIAARIPAIVHQGTTSGLFYSVETAVAGQDGAAILRKTGSAQEMILASAHFLSRLHKASAATSPSSSWVAPFESCVAEVRQLAVRAGCAADYDDLAADIRGRLAGQPLAPVYSHGNLWLGNVLFDSSGNLAGVIDWDCAFDSMLPALDLIYLLVRAHGLARSASFGVALADWIEARSVPVLDGCIARHCRELSVPIDLIATLSYCCWIQQLHIHARFATAASADARWLRRNVADVLGRWRRQSAALDRGDVRWRSAS
jgi:aminoglycoside phosphotransferase (APT) family kinase protein